MEFGAKARAKKRKQRKEHIRQRVEYAITERKARNRSKSDQENYQEDIDGLFKQIAKDYTKYSEQCFAHNYARSLLVKEKKVEELGLRLPGVWVERSLGDNQRTLRLFKAESVATEFYKIWSAFLLDKPRKFSDKELLVNCIYSAMFHGGLNDYHSLNALYDQLISHNFYLQSAGEYYWINLIPKGGERANNCSIGEKPRSVHVWYVDAVTLVLIARFLEQRIREKKSGRVDDFGNLMKSTHSMIPETKRFKRNQLKAICKHSVAVTESLYGADLPQAYVSYTKGDLPSASLCPKSLRAFFSHQYGEVVSRRYSFYLDPSTIARSKSLNGQGRVTDSTYRELSSCLQSKDDSDKAIAKLSKWIDLGRAPDHVLMLATWFRAKLRHEQVKLSTARRYNSSLSQGWIYEAIDVEEMLADPHSLEEIYSLIVESKESYKEQEAVKKALRQFHRFCVENYSFPNVDYFTGYGSGSNGAVIPSVKATYINEPSFICLLASLDNLTDIHPETKKALKCIAILGFRLGLRIAECLGLSIGSLELDVTNLEGKSFVSRERWIYLKNGKYLKLKTGASRRRVPLAYFLTAEERVIFDEYIAGRLEQYSSQNALLFSVAGEAHVPLCRKSLSRLFSDLIKSSSGLDASFHQLRHSAISRLFLVAGLNTNQLTEYVPYTREQLKALRELLIGKRYESYPADIFHAISAFAGHSSPATTFGSYIHFIDMALGAKLNEADYSLTVREITNLTKSQGKKIKGIYELNGQNTIDSLRSWAIERIGSFQKNRRKLRRVELYKGSVPIESIRNKVFVPEPPADISSSVVHAIFKNWHERIEVDELAKLCRQPETIMPKYIERAKYLTTITTSKDKARMQGGAYRNLISVAQPKTKVDRALVAQFLENYYSEIQSNWLKDKAHANPENQRKGSVTRSDVAFAIRYIYRTSNIGQADIRFSRPENLSRFLKLARKIVPARRLKLEIAHLVDGDRSANTKAWKKSAGGRKAISVAEDSVANENTYPLGKLNLRVSVNDERDYLQESCGGKKMKRYSSNLLHYVLNVIAVYEFNLEELRSMRLDEKREPRKS